MPDESHAMRIKKDKNRVEDAEEGVRENREGCSTQDCTPTSKSILLKRRHSSLKTTSGCGLYKHLSGTSRVGRSKGERRAVHRGRGKHATKGQDAHS